MHSGIIDNVHLTKDVVDDKQQKRPNLYVYINKRSLGPDRNRLINCFGDASTFYFFFLCSRAHCQVTINPLEYQPLAQDTCEQFPPSRPFLLSFPFVFVFLFKFLAMAIRSSPFPHFSQVLESQRTRPPDRGTHQH